jgi:hypothetical protein
MSSNTELAAQQAAGLRALADMIERNPESAPLARTYLGNLNAFYAWTKSDMQTLVRAAKAAGADVSKDAREGIFTARFTWGPITAKVLGDQELVCEKRVETKTIVEEVPDPEAVAQLPKVLVTRTEEVVTWECKPWMAADGEKTAVA